jgi:hypothetical protein
VRAHLRYLHFRGPSCARSGDVPAAHYCAQLCGAIHEFMNRESSGEGPGEQTANLGQGGGAGRDG